MPQGVKSNLTAAEKVYFEYMPNYLHLFHPNRFEGVLYFVQNYQDIILNLLFEIFYPKVVNGCVIVSDFDE